MSDSYMAAVSSRTAETVLAKKIVGFGNPLLDISANVGQDVLDEWGAKLNNAILAEEQFSQLDPSELQVTERSHWGYDEER